MYMARGQAMQMSTRMEQGLGQQQSTRTQLAPCSQAFQLFSEEPELWIPKCWQPIQNCFKHYED